MKTAYDLVWIAGERTPDHLALVDDRTDRKLTYRQLLAEIDVVAAGFARAASRPAAGLQPSFLTFWNIALRFWHCSDWRPFRR